MALLKQVKGPGAGLSVALGVAPVVVGRSPQCDFQVQDLNLSRRHFQVLFDEARGCYLAMDLGSRNGTFVAGKDIAKRPAEDPLSLSEGDEILAGGSSFVFEMAVEEAPRKQAALDLHQFITSTSKLFNTTDTLRDKRLQALYGGLKQALMEPVEQEVVPTLMDMAMDASPQIGAMRLYLLNENGTPKKAWESRGQQRLPEPPDGLLEHVLEGHEVRLVLPGQSRAPALCVPVSSGRGEMEGALFAALAPGLEDQQEEEVLAFLSAYGSLTGLVLGNAHLIQRMSQEMRLRNRLQRFLSPEVVDRLRDGEDETVLSHQKETVTVLFTNLFDFTGLCEALPVEQVVAILHTVQSEMSTIVLEYHGTLDKYLGDGLMAIFGAPVPYEDHALMALRAARRMQVEMDELNSEFHLQGLPQLKLGVGVNTGQAIVGAMGSRERMEYTAIGHMVNEASGITRLTEVLDRPILAGQTTLKAVGGRFDSGLVDQKTVAESGLSTDIYWIDAFGEEKRG